MSTNSAAHKQHAVKPYLSRHQSTHIRIALLPAEVQVDDQPKRSVKPHRVDAHASPGLEVGSPQKSLALHHHHHGDKEGV